jgi:hypothetical protein
MRILLVLLALLAPPVRADESDGSITTSVPEYHAPDAQAAVVTEQNLLASERFWPYQVALTEAWQPVGRAQPLGPEASGVLIRVEASGVARVDIGRDGLYEVPVAKTYLVKLANRIRLGELEKTAPNFVLAIGPRLIDSASDTLRPFPFGAASEAGGFLCVFADPDAPGFAGLAAALAPLRERDGVLTIFFPQGEHSDARVRERLRSLNWPVAFVYDHLSDAYTATLLSEASPTPAVLLQTREGRTLFQSRWRTDVVPALTSALADAFGSALGPAPIAVRGARP